MAQPGMDTPTQFTPGPATTWPTPVLLMLPGGRGTWTRRAAMRLCAGTETPAGLADW